MWGAPGAAAVGGAAGAKAWTTDGGDDKKKRSPLPIIIAIVIAVIAAVAVFFFVSSALGGDDAEITITGCDIAADGTLTATGTLESASEVDGSLDVRFDNAEDGSEVDSTSTDVSGAADESIEWSASGAAGDDVARVTCTAGPLN